MGAGCVFAFARLRKTMIALSETNEILERLDKSKSLLLRETAHGVANNFATVAALLSMKSISVDDIEAKRTLDEAIEQVKIMARVHRAFERVIKTYPWTARPIFANCVTTSKRWHGGRPAIECEADSRPLCMQQAVLLGLIVNELVTNAMKHAFPDDRAGRIRVRLKGLDTQLRLSVDDDGVGFGRRSRNGADMGHGQALVRGLAHELGGDLELQSTTNGSVFRLTFPLAGLGPSTASPHSGRYRFSIDVLRGASPCRPRLDAERDSNNHPHSRKGGCGSRSCKKTWGGIARGRRPLRGPRKPDSTRLAGFRLRRCSH